MKIKRIVNRLEQHNQISDPVFVRSTTIIERFKVYCILFTEGSAQTMMNFGFGSIFFH